ncbi:GFA family protein [Vibrio ruber]|uniref:GFA family protein n=1 Tax=Vibrio ruber TaxID=184755 RepID=UPI002892DC74|nr:GFA family protein [Vibrio ruber]WNJ94830.1 GFA family protein [Vibrio ruber]
MKVYQGSCLCGQVTYEVRGLSKDGAHCHCSMCRKFHGAAFGTLFTAEHVQWTSGQSLVKEYVAPNGTIRTFCRECGSSLGFRGKDVPQSRMEVAIATLDDDIEVTPDAHIYTRYKSNWYVIDDHLPRFDEGREGE